jgi:phosphoglycerate dehydrogenase-like enzyme
MCLLSHAEQWLPKADIVICCIPNNTDTVHFLNDKRLRLMKEDALLINMGRGNFIVTDELIKIMGEGHLLGAALDVTEPEPLPPGHPLWDMENVMITPHIAGPSFSHCPETEDKIAAICCDNLKRYASGLPLKNLIL